jgi:phage-related protein
MASILTTKPLIWIGSTRRDLSAFPTQVKNHVGYALHVAQQGGKHRDAKPLRGFGGAAVVEIVAQHDGDAYRAVYAVRIAEVIFVLHVFQKKSKSGIETPQADIELIQKRLRDAEQIAKDLTR